eukprot:4481782-Pyramimonas_sp.AAC.1
MAGGKDYDVPTYLSFDHQKSFRAPRKCRILRVLGVGPWGAILVRHCFDTCLGARYLFLGCGP